MVLLIQLVRLVGIEAEPHIDAVRFREMTARDVGRVLCLATAMACALLHAATFMTIVPGLLMLVPFFLMTGAVLFARLTQGWNLSAYLRRRPSIPTGKTAIAGWLLLAYAILLFVYFYRSSGGASSVGIVDGQYVYMYKETVIRPITESEYRMFPTQVVRIMTAWLAMMITFCFSSLIGQENDRSAEDDLNSTS